VSAKLNSVEPHKRAETRLSCDEFLSVFFPNENELIRLRAFVPRDVPPPPGREKWNAFKIDVTRNSLRTNEVLKQKLKRLNKERGIYVVVNSGGDIDDDINRYNGFFVECDNSTIPQQHDALDAAPINPSVRVETRKSVHAYFPIEGACSEEELRDVQCRLIEYFNGDVNIKNPSRVMRLPEFDHIHYDTLNGEFQRKQINCVELDSTRRYTVAEMQAAFPSAKEKPTVKRKPT